jgi:hypothetical protein
MWSARNTGASHVVGIPDCMGDAKCKGPETMACLCCAAGLGILKDLDRSDDLKGGKNSETDREVGLRTKRAICTCIR